MTGPATPATSADIELDIDCPDAPFFTLSESPDFGASAETGVQVEIDAIDPAGDYVDVSIRYPGGRPGGNGEPFAVADGGRELRILAVLFDFGDDSLTKPAYATPAWAQKLLFDGDHDGRGLDNTIKAHLEQNTYGTVSISGEVYPDWVDIKPIEAYRDLDEGPTSERQFADDIVEELLATNPKFFAGKEFDILIALTPGALAATTVQPYSIYQNWTDPAGLFEGWAMYDLPVDSESPVFGSIADEQRVSTTASVVVPRYNPQSVDGVWLASDVERTGINYFSGGTVRYDLANPNYFAQFIELGTPLPAANAAISISYTPRAYRRLSDAQMATAAPETMPETSWFSLVVHELYHASGWLLNPLGKHVLDLYQSPIEMIGNYGVMALGSNNRQVIDGVAYQVPAGFSAYSRTNLGIVRPYTLRYGENETALRLYRAEDNDFATSSERTKVVKVPLHATGEIGRRMLVDPYGNERQYAGDEYLLLEWRQSGPLANGSFNFDAALPDSGLVIYRVIEGNSEIHGDSYSNIVGIVDATPASLPVESLNALARKQSLSLESSAAPFGDASGVYDYVAAASRNWKAAGRTSTDFRLSAGEEQKTIYAQFMDLDGQIVAESTVSVSGSAVGNAPPIAVAGNDRVLVEDGDGLVSVALDGGESTDPDGDIVEFAWWEAGAVIAEGESLTVTLASGEHMLTLTVTDDKGASASDELVVEVRDAAVTAPGSLTASVSADDVTLDWFDQSGNEAGYQVERGVRTKGNEVFATIATVGANTTRYVAPIASGSYLYRVRAIAPDGSTSDSSNVVKVSVRGGGKGRS